MRAHGLQFIFLQTDVSLLTRREKTPHRASKEMYTEQAPKSYTAIDRASIHFLGKTEYGQFLFRFSYRSDTCARNASPPDEPAETTGSTRPMAAPAVLGLGILTASLPLPLPRRPTHSVPPRSLLLPTLILELLMIPSSPRVAPGSPPPTARRLLPRSLSLLPLPTPPLPISRETSVSRSAFPPFKPKSMLPSAPPNSPGKLSKLGIGVSSLGILKPPR